MQNSITAAESTVRSADLPTAYDRVQQVITEAEEANLSRSRDIRGPLAELVGTLERRAMDALDEARGQYFDGEHEQAHSRFEELAALQGLRAAREAVGELRKEDDRAEWRSLRDTVTSQMTANDYLAAQTSLRDLARLGRRTGYDAATDSLLESLGTGVQSHIDRAEQAIADEDYDAAYGVLLEVSRLSPLREQANQARQLLREHGSTPGMRQAQREYESADLLEELRQDLAEADGRRNAPALRQQAQRKLEQLASQYEGTRAAEQAQQLADELADQLAAN